MEILPVGAVAVADHGSANQSGVSWPAIFAGAAGAAALSYVLLILGFGLGLSSVSPWMGKGADAATIGIATIVWLAFTQIAASGMGGYLAGRLRVKWTSVHDDEIYFRDTAHGFLSWAVASLVVVVFLASAVGNVISGGASAAGSALSGAGGVIASAAGGAAGAAASDKDDGSAYFVDSLFRSTGTPAPAAAPAPGTDPAAMTPPAPPAARGDRGEVTRIMLNGVRTGTLAEADKQYLAQVVARETGTTPAEAQQRVQAGYDSLKQSIDEAKTKAKQVADDARKLSAHLALWLFVSLLLGAFFASFAATLGGRRRDADLPLTRRSVR